MPLDSNEQSPCVGCNLKNQPKVTREKHGSATFQLRNECKDCKPLDDYKSNSTRLYAYHPHKVVHEINERAIKEIGMQING